MNQAKRSLNRKNIQNKKFSTPQEFFSTAISLRVIPSRAPSFLDPNQTLSQGV
jgi:hypothetical protein